MLHRKIFITVLLTFVGFIAGNQAALANPTARTQPHTVNQPPAHVPNVPGKVDQDAKAHADAEEAAVNAAQANADDPAANGEEEVDKHGNKTSAVDVVLEEEHALLGTGFTFELGTVYTRFDRRELLLDGFLVLDALFFGDIAISKIESDSITAYVLGRYSFGHRVQTEVYVPYTYRRSVYHKNGQDGDSTVLQSTTESQDPELGDITASVYIKAHPETLWWPDIVIYIQAKSTTGKKPYGIKEKLIGEENDNFRVPKSMPTGSGVWATTVGASFVKTFDPVVLFANLGFTHNFKSSFSDISSLPNTKAPGSINLGNVYLVGFGVALAMNERIAMNISFSEAFSEKTSIKGKGSVLGFEDIPDSEGNAAQINIGGTFAFSPRYSMVLTVGNGLTPDAPGVTVSAKVVGYLG